MAWSRFDDLYAQHPKMVALGDFYEVGLALDVAGIGWCNLNRTDGVVPKAQVPRLIRCVGMRIGRTVVTPELVADRLVSVGRWLDEGDAYRIHDYLKYNPSRAQVDAKRQATADRVQRHRNARCNAVTSAEKRECTPAPEPEPVPLLHTQARAPESPPAPEPVRAVVMGLKRPLPDDFVLTEARRLLFIAHKCEDPDLCFTAFRTHYEGLRDDHERGWRSNWDNKLMAWCLNHESFASPCHKRHRAKPQPDGPKYRDLSSI